MDHKSVEKTHKYAIRLIRSGPQKDDRFKPIETVALERVRNTFKDAVWEAIRFGGKKRTWIDSGGTRRYSDMPVFINGVATYRSRSKRFCRIEIAIVPLDYLAE